MVRGVVVGAACRELRDRHLNRDWRCRIQTVGNSKGRSDGLGASIRKVACRHVPTGEVHANGGESLQ